MEGYDYDICYKKGKKDTNVDALSKIAINTLENKSVFENVLIPLMTKRQGWGIGKHDTKYDHYRNLTN